LEIGEGVRLRQGDGNSIVVRDVEPQDLWRAMDRAVPDWEDQRLFFVLSSSDPRRNRDRGSRFSRRVKALLLP
jgi:hypothetical protein